MSEAVKPGYKTLPFYVAALVAGLGLTFATGALDAGIGAQIGSLVVTTLAAFGYSVSRGITKADGSVVRAGVKSSEFWLALAAVLVSLAYASDAFADNDMILRVLGVVGGLLTAIGYKVGGSAMKSGGGGAA